MIVFKLKLRVDKKLYLGLGPLVVLLVIGSVCLFNTVQFINTSRRFSDTHHLLSKLENILALVSDAESAARGFALTGDETLLGPYRNATAAINREMDTASILVRGSAAQKERMGKLGSAVGNGSRAPLATRVDAKRGLFLCEAWGGGDTASRLSPYATGKLLLHRPRWTNPSCIACV